jgi:hypothetical protein
MRTLPKSGRSACDLFIYFSAICFIDRIKFINRSDYFVLAKRLFGEKIKGSKFREGLKSMIMPMIMAMQGIHYAHQGANLMFGAMDRQMALANRVTGNESPRDIAQLARMDKALALQAAHAQTMYQVGLAMQASAAKMQEQDRKLKENLMKAGATFV